MKLLHIVSTLDPVGGGPMEGVLQSGLACVRMGHSVEVATLDDPAAEFLRGFPLPVHALGPGFTGYAYSPRFKPWLKAHAADYHAVIVNGLWQYHVLAAWQALHAGPVPYFVFPHGMLDPWFKRTHPIKHLRKWLYWPWGEYRLLRDANAVLFTCEEERRVARQSFSLYRARETVVSFGTAPPPADGAALRETFLQQFPALRGKTLLLFLSRIHPKKGCDLLIEAFARIASSAPDLHLVMAGPNQLGWQAQLQSRAEALGLNGRISWPGMLRGDLKWGAFYASQAYVLPSHQENFGIAVAEALACGLPVLISDKVNIWREIDGAGAGIVEPDTVAGTERALRRWWALSPTQAAQMKQNAVDVFASRFSVQAMATSLLEVAEQHSAARTTGPSRNAPAAVGSAP